MTPYFTQIRYNSEEGLYHVILVSPQNIESDVSAHCDRDEAEMAEHNIKHWAEDWAFRESVTKRKK